MKPCVPRTPQSQEDKAEAYLRAMLEVKARLSVISIMQKADWPINLRLEVCYLQLRHICELVTIGSVIIQGDYSSDLGNKYAPGPIFKMLETKYEGSFPQSATVSTTDTGMRIVANSVPDAMTKTELIDLWNKTGDKLHRLKLSKFFNSYDTAKPSDQMAEIDLAVTKLRALLDTHIVPMHNPKTLVLVNLFGAGGDPNASFAKYETNGSVTFTPYRAKGATGFFHG
jgi:hypothetical protein